MRMAEMLLYLLHLSRLAAFPTGKRVMQACPVVLAVLLGRCYTLSTCPFSEVKPGYDCSGHKKDLCLDGVCVNSWCSKYSIDNIEKSRTKLTADFLKQD